MRVRTIGATMRIVTIIAGMKIVVAMVGTAMLTNILTAIAMIAAARERQVL